MRDFIDTLLYHDTSDPSRILLYYVLAILILLLSLAVGYVFNQLSFWVVKRMLRKKENLFLDSIYRHLRLPMSWVWPFLMSIATLELQPWPNEAAQLFVKTLLRIALLILAGWTFVQFTAVIGDIVRKHYDLAQEDNLNNRKIITQLQFIRRIATAIIIFLTIATILLQFEEVRRLGEGLLTSAGVAGIIIGFAAQKSLANLLAGFQIAFTQPIRIDDAVIVEGEWGQVEEITLTYVVVQIWDKRRLVLPLNYFIEKPFQNWTRTSADLIGVVFLYTDYKVPVDAIRQELARLLDQHEL
ncbi:MAG: mechanosensitive ion channel domain-containing protein, partial [Bacteroidota bacterium]